MSDPILIIPCSGIGKPLGTIGREAAYLVIEDLKKGETGTVCLSLLVMGDREAQKLVESKRCIAVDGCASECSKKNLQLKNAKLAASFRVLDVVKEYRELKPKSVTFLDEDGRKMARHLANKIASEIDELNKESSK